MTDKEKRKAFNSELMRIRREYAKLHKDSVTELNSILDAALVQITLILQATPTDYQTWLLPQLEGQIKAVMDSVAQQGTAVTQTGLAAAWANGIATVDGPLLAAGISIGAVAPTLDVRQLAAITHVSTKKITGITAEAVHKINTQLGLVLMGAQPFSDAVTAITDILEQTERYPANRILRTELSRVNSIASHLRKVQAADYVPGMKKQWRKSRRKHPRESHVAADGQVRGLSEAFDIGSIKMQHPHDPTAPASEVINCGCISLPYMDSWEVRYKGKRDIPS